MMFRIAKVEIQGFWGTCKAVTSLYPDVTIFIGRNGSGKTTFMDLLQGVLRIDLRVLASLDFDSVVVHLEDQATTTPMTVTKRKVGGAPSDEMVFKIGSTTYTLPVYPREYYEDLYLRRPIRNARLEKEYGRLKKELDRLLRVTSLSVHRTAHETTYEDEEYLTRHRVRRSPIEQRLESLARQLTSYQLSLAEQANQISSAFQRDVLTSMLYDESFDTFDPGSIRDTELNQEKKDLARAYEELGVLDKDVSKRIDQHIAILKRSLAALHDPEKPGGDAGPTRQSREIGINDIMPLPLLHRTQHIINLSLQAQQQKQDVFQPIQRFVRIVSDFMDDKEVKIDPKGDLVIRKDGAVIALADLSSGEKQLLILLTETLLQKNEPFIFLADEPELSLHIEWQAKIIAAIREINPYCQIIVATHSPEIAGGWKGNVIDMEDVINAQG